MQHHENFFIKENTVQYGFKRTIESGAYHWKQRYERIPFPQDSSAYSRTLFQSDNVRVDMHRYAFRHRRWISLSLILLHFHINWIFTVSTSFKITKRYDCKSGHKLISLCSLFEHCTIGQFVCLSVEVSFGHFYWNEVWKHDIVIDKILMDLVSLLLLWIYIRFFRTHRDS